MKKWMVSTLFAALVSGTAGAQTVNVSMSERDVQFDYISVRTSTGLGRSNYDFTLLAADRNGYNNWMAGGGINVSGVSRVEVPGLEFGVGLKFYTMEVDKYDVTAIPLGGHVRYAPPTMNRLYMIGSAYWAPAVTTLYDGKEFLYTSARIGYDILPNADLFVGYHDITVDIKRREEHRLTDTWFIGARMTF